MIAVNENSANYRQKGLPTFSIYHKFDTVSTGTRANLCSVPVVTSTGGIS
jgi:hypothetical protein